MEEPGLTLNVEAGTPPVIRAVGELNYENCDQFAAAMRDARRLSDGPVALDLNALDFCDSSGLRVLMLAAKAAQQDGATLRIASMTPQLNHLLEVSGFHRLFDISGSEEQITPVTPTGQRVQPPFSFYVPAALVACRDARARVSEFATSVGCDHATLDDIRLAIGEAVSNAVRHGNCNGGHIAVDCRADEGLLVVMLKYASQAFDPDSVPVPDLDDPPEGRMGIHFMRLVMDSLDYAFNSGLVTVTLTKRLNRN
jgi:anti-anti-sigma factor